MNIFKKPIWTRLSTKILAQGQYKLFDEMREAHEDDITAVTAMPPGFSFAVEGGTTMTREDWLVIAAIELTELTEQIDKLAAYI